MQQVLPQSHADLAEACLNLALLENEDEEGTNYKAALDHIRKAQEVAKQQQIEYSLPEGLQNFWDESQEEE